MRRNFKNFFVVSYETVMSLVFSFPRFKIFNFLKSVFLKANGAKVGKRVVFYPGVWIVPGKNLDLGDDVDLAKDVLLTTSGGISIGDRTLVGYRTCIFSSNHVIPRKRGSIFFSGHRNEAVSIENDVWIGAGCTILPGVSIGEGAVVAAGSVVSKNVAPFTIVAGVPAKVVKERI